MLRATLFLNMSKIELLFLTYSYSVVNYKFYIKTAFKYSHNVILLLTCVKYMYEIS